MDFWPLSPVRVYIIHKVAPRRWRHTRLWPKCTMVPMGRVQMICDFRNYNYWTGNAIGFRASSELCSNFLFGLEVMTSWKFRSIENPAHRPSNLSNSTFRVYTSTPLPSPKPYKRPYRLGIYTYHTHQTILVSTKPRTVITVNCNFAPPLNDNLIIAWSRHS